MTRSEGAALVYCPEPVAFAAFARVPTSRSTKSAFYNFLVYAGIARISKKLAKLACATSANGILPLRQAYKKKQRIETDVHGAANEVTLRDHSDGTKNWAGISVIAG
jgi:hypothetical protein